MEYPKSLYLKGWEDLSATVIVNSPEEEDAARKDGYKSLGEENGKEVQEETPVKPKRTRKAA